MKHVWYLPRNWPRILWMLVVLFAMIIQVVPVNAGPLNMTIFDSHPHQVHYYPESICTGMCSNWFYRLISSKSYQPWKRVYFNDKHTGGLSTMHQSLNHHSVQMTIDFHGSAVWIFGCPLRELQTLPADHKICIYTQREEDECFRVNATEAYLAASDDSSPVLVFAKGHLSNLDHRISISLADPTDDLSSSGLAFTHATYTTDRPTSWPADEDSWRFRNVSMYDTHPHVAFLPRPPLTTCGQYFWLFCVFSRAFWAAKEYRSLDGTLSSYHLLQVSSFDRSQPPSTDVTFQGASAFIYGVPRAQLDRDATLLPICVRLNHRSCEPVDLDHAYLNTGRKESVLLWHSRALDPLHQTHLSIEALTSGNDDGQPRTFAFERIHYQEEKEYSSPYQLTGSYRNVSVDHSHQDVRYRPDKRCSRKFLFWCIEWFETWTWQSTGPQSAVRTYRSTFAGYWANEDPVATFSFRGSAIYVYGSPRGAWYQSRAHQRFCLDNECREIDVTHAYLNPPPISPSLNAITTDDELSLSLNNDSVLANNWLNPEFEPVLLYSMDGLDDNIMHTMELRLSPTSDPYFAVMTLSQIVYTEVTYESDHPRLPSPSPGVYPPPPPAFPEHAVRWIAPPPAPPSPPEPCPPLFPFSMEVVMKVMAMAMSVLGCINCVRWVASSITGAKKETIKNDTVRNYSAIPVPRTSAPPPYTRWPSTADNR